MLICSRRKQHKPNKFDNRSDEQKRVELDNVSKSKQSKAAINNGCTNYIIPFQNMATAAEKPANQEQQDQQFATSTKDDSNKTQLGRRSKENNDSDEREPNSSFRLATSAQRTKCTYSNKELVKIRQSRNRHYKATCKSDKKMTLPKVTGGKCTTTTEIKPRDRICAFGKTKTDYDKRRNQLATDHNFSNTSCHSGNIVVDSTKVDHQLQAMDKDIENRSESGKTSLQDTTEIYQKLAIKNLIQPVIEVSRAPVVQCCLSPKKTSAANGDNSMSITDHSKAVSSKSFPCMFCGTWFSNLPILEAHQIHYCSKRFNTPENRPTEVSSVNERNSAPAEIDNTIPISPDYAQIVANFYAQLLTASASSIVSTTPTSPLILTNRVQPPTNWTNQNKSSANASNKPIFVSANQDVPTASPTNSNVVFLHRNPAHSDSFSSANPVIMLPCAYANIAEKSVRVIGLPHTVIPVAVSKNLSACSVQPLSLDHDLIAGMNVNLAPFNEARIPILIKESDTLISYNPDPISTVSENQPELSSTGSLKTYHACSTSWKNREILSAEKSPDFYSVQRKMHNEEFASKVNLSNLLDRTQQYLVEKESSKQKKVAIPPSKPKNKISQLIHAAAVIKLKPFPCPNCTATFSSQKTLEGHLSFYCLATKNSSTLGQNNRLAVGLKVNKIRKIESNSENLPENLLQIKNVPDVPCGSYYCRYDTVIKMPVRSKVVSPAVSSPVTYSNLVESETTNTHEIKRCHSADLGKFNIFDNLPAKKRKTLAEEARRNEEPESKFEVGKMPLFLCRFCRKAFKIQRAFEIHICDKLRKRTLSVHRRRAKNGILLVQYKCKLCTYCSSYKGNLKRHSILMHGRLRNN